MSLPEWASAYREVCCGIYLPYLEVHGWLQVGLSKVTIVLTHIRGGGGVITIVITTVGDVNPALPTIRKYIM